MNLKRKIAVLSAVALMFGSTLFAAVPALQLAAG